MLAPRSEEEPRIPPAPFRRILALVLVLAGGSVAEAAVIVVAPGPGTPVQDAINAATPGDTIRLEGGGYPEAIVVNKPLTIAGPPGTVYDNDPHAAASTSGSASA